MKRVAVIAIVLSFVAIVRVQAQAVELIKYGDFENWETRNIRESKVIGGQLKQVYEIAPNAVINEAAPYENMGGSPWATSNVYANVMGVVKTSNTVYPDRNPAGGRCWQDDDRD